MYEKSSAMMSQCKPRMWLLCPWIMCFLAVAGCRPAKTFHYFRTGEVTCIENDARLVTVSSLYRAGNATEAQIYAERNALENLLFKGIAGCYDIPVVADETASRRQHKAFYDWLIDKREYERFISERTVNTLNSSSGHVTLQMNITFDVTALRKEMERQGVIRKFGL